MCVRVRVRVHMHAFVNDWPGGNCLVKGNSPEKGIRNAGQ